MFLKFQLFCLTLLVVTGDILEFKESTVFIYYDVVCDLPDCLGTLITANHALTGASCFIKPKKSKLDFITHSSDKNAIVVRVIPFTSNLNRIRWGWGGVRECQGLLVFSSKNMLT